MMQKCPELTGLYGIEVTGHTVPGQILTADGSKFEPVIGKPGDGSSPHCAIIDEFHEHQTSELRDTMETGMGARRQPLCLVISTAGTNLAGPCREDWKACEKMLESIEGFIDETHFAVIWTIDDGEDWTTEAALAKANPNWGVSVHPEVILPALEVAKRDPRKQSAFKTKHLNQWVAAKNAYFNAEEWNRLADESLSPDQFAEFPCYLAADMASKHDLTVLMSLFCLPDKRYALFGKYYLPEATVELPENQHYSSWVRAGWITKTDGEITDMDVLINDAEAACKAFQVAEAPMDPARAWLVATALQKRGVPVVEYRNTVLQMSEPMKELDALIRSKRIVHNGDPVLAWAISNVTAKKDLKENVFPNKESERQKIDPVVASIFALGRAMLRPDTPYLKPGIYF
jgi:phage terminase large subunit-like protein